MSIYPDPSHGRSSPHTVVKECREALGLSQAAVAKLAGVSQADVSHFESNLGWKLMAAMQPLLADRVTSSCTDQRPDAAAMRALARLTEALNADRKH